MSETTGNRTIRDFFGPPTNDPGDPNDSEDIKRMRDDQTPLRNTLWGAQGCQTEPVLFDLKVPNGQDFGTFRRRLSDIESGIYAPKRSTFWKSPASSLSLQMGSDDTRDVEVPAPMTEEELISTFPTGLEPITQSHREQHFDMPHFDMNSLYPSILHFDGVPLSKKEQKKRIERAKWDICRHCQKKQPLGKYKSQCVKCSDTFLFCSAKCLSCHKKKVGHQ